MTLASWLEPLYDAARMRAIDAWAIEERGIPSLELMERAGEGLARAAAEMAPAGRIVVIAGKGNNGGDGLVAARLLRAAGREVEVLMVAGGGALSADAAANLERLGGAAPTALTGDLPADAALVVDALLGTGATGAPRGEVAAAIAAVAAWDGLVLAADVPSGVDASSGEVAGAAVAAQATASFHAAKPGLWIEPGRGHAGRVAVIDIGIPAGAPPQADVGLIRDTVLAEIPVRSVGSTKFSSGRVLVAGGSRGLTGAPSLSSLAAARAGAGYVTACVPAALADIFEARLLETMTLALPDRDGSHGPEGVAALLEAATARDGAHSALALGPGLGRGEGVAAFVRGVLAGVSLPVVLDADGLNAYHADIDALGGAAAVLTPHEGELARLLGHEGSTAISASRLRWAREAAARAQAVVLKGDDTLVVAADGTVAVSPGATPALATAGTGDVLTGITAAMLAKGLDPFTAACAAVRLHARAAVAATAVHGVEGLIASDVIEALATVRGR